MNSSTYIFGELSNGYSQYPDDSSSNLFRDIQPQCVAPSQLIIHRDEDLMYYIYVRKFDKKKYIGFAIAIRGYFFTDVKSLFSLFEKELEALVETGVIINLSNNGEITTNLLSLKDEEEEVISVINSILVNVNNLKSLKKLPPVDFSVAISSRKLFKDTDLASEIANASCRFGFTIVLKETDFDSIRTTSFKNVLKNLSADKNALIKENKELKEQNKKIQRQKKEFKKVVFLLLTVAACGVGIYLLYNNLNNTQDELNSAIVNIKKKNSIIDKRNEHISALKDSVSNLENSLQQIKREKSELNDKLEQVCNSYPFIVTESEVNSERYKFNYYSLEEKEITVTLKAINDKNSEIVSSTHTIFLHKGDGTISLDFNKKLNNQSFYSSSQYYYVVIIYNGQIIAGKYW